jgi:DNA-directed RNA polymerase specialized sigma24 family protein
MDPAQTHAQESSGDSPLQLAASELVRFDASRAAEHLARLEGDAELNTQLMLNGYAGPLWDRLANALAEYGIQVIGAWICGRKRTIFQQCRAKGVGSLVPSEYTAEEGFELALETVAKAIVTFRDNVLKPGKWKPARGATLKTFFIGQCVYQFPNIYRRWQTAEDNERLLAQQMRAADPEAFRATSKVDEVAHARRELAKLAVKAPDDPAVLRFAHRQGYSFEELAEIAGTTVRALEGRLYRAGKKNRDG